MRPTPIPHSRTVTIGGKRWRLEYGRVKPDNDGECDPPDAARKRIVIRSSLRRYGYALLITLIHESLHASGWPLDEAFVEQAAEDIARLLWSQGYRLNGAKDDEYTED